MHLRRLIVIGNSYGFTIPRDLVIRLGLRPGDYAQFRLVPNGSDFGILITRQHPNLPPTSANGTHGPPRLPN